MFSGRAVGGCIIGCFSLLAACVELLIVLEYGSETKTGSRPSAFSYAVLQASVATWHEAVLQGQQMLPAALCWRIGPALPGLEEA